MLSINQDIFLGEKALKNIEKYDKIGGK